MKAVFHVGFPKSGSTFLQWQCFCHLEEYAYMGIHAAKDNKPLYDLLDRFHTNIFKTDGLNFDYEQACKDLDTIRNLSNQKPSLFSYEYGIGVLFGYPDAITKARRLHEVFGDNIKIIIIVREQKSILVSHYRDHPFEPHDIHRGKPVSFEKWYNLTNNLRYFRATDLVHYTKLINEYDKLFGKENVLVLPMEYMSHNPQDYAQKMGVFLGVDPAVIESHIKKDPVNIGKSAGTNRIRKLRRKFPLPVEFSKILPPWLYKAVINIIQKGGSEKIEISHRLEQTLNKRYGPTNKLLQDRINLPLGDLGYPMCDE